MAPRVRRMAEPSYGPVQEVMDEPTGPTRRTDQQQCERLDLRGNLVPRSLLENRDRCTVRGKQAEQVRQLLRARRQRPPASAARHRQFAPVFITATHPRRDDCRHYCGTSGFLMARAFHAPDVDHLVRKILSEVLFMAIYSICE
ncbi:hypothetical protein Nepgr_020707 [Nepenthes gracilis]|uniref:Uncharacterized protein n=1 Tax=Nepenthes gracilis TaxID=150966 RepID=A0AAD3SXR7_NEPGR|nr:hypothetical protein Nepgr_020707 [Nepenthes gracilis]